MKKLSPEMAKLLFQFGLFLAVYILLGKPLLNFLGITKSKNEKEILKNSENPSSPLNKIFWRKYFYQSNVMAYGRKPITSSMLNKCTKNAKDIFDSFGYLYDDEPKVKASFKNCINQSEVSLTAFEFSRLYSSDLLEYLSEGRGLMPQNGLNDSEIVEILNFVNKLKPA